MALLNSPLHFVSQIKAVIHMDMVGGGPETEAVFHVTRGPMSLPSFVHDVAWAFADWVNEESYKFAATGAAEYPMVAPEGGKEPLRAEYSPFSMGSDHEVYQDSSFKIPAIYLNDWPDRYIHTNFDTAANIDPTKLKRVAFIGAASAYFLARMQSTSAGDIDLETIANRLRRAAWMIARQQRIPSDGPGRLVEQSNYENGVIESVRRFAPDSAYALNRAIEAGAGADLIVSGSGRDVELPEATGSGVLKFRRVGFPKGPLMVFGYDYFADHVKAAGVATPKLFGYEGLWGSGEEYAYEILNFADGKRNTQEIRDAVSAECGPIPLELVAEYLEVLEKIGVLEKIK